MNDYTSMAELLRECKNNGSIPDYLWLKMGEGFVYYILIDTATIDIDIEINQLCKNTGYCPEYRWVWDSESFSALKKEVLSIV